MRKMLALSVAATAIACAGTSPSSRPTPIAAAGPPPGAVIRGPRIIPPTWTLRAGTVTATHTMVVSAHPLTYPAAVDILRQGRNAMDPAIAAGLAPEAVLPARGNIGCAGVIVQRTATGREP